MPTTYSHVFFAIVQAVMNDKAPKAKGKKFSANKASGGAYGQHCVHSSRNQRCKQHIKDLATKWVSYFQSLTFCNNPVCTTTGDSDDSHQHPHIKNMVLRRMSPKENRAYVNVPILYI